MDASAHTWNLSPLGMAALGRWPDWDGRGSLIGMTALGRWPDWDGRGSLIGMTALGRWPGLIDWDGCIWEVGMVH